MKPIQNFHEDTRTMRGTEAHVDDLHVLPQVFDYAGPVLISCWRVTWRDLLRMLYTRKLWLIVQGITHPPVTIETDQAYTGIDEQNQKRINQ